MNVIKTQKFDNKNHMIKLYFFQIQNSLYNIILQQNLLIKIKLLHLKKAQMSFFGVELNAQINRLVYNIKLILAKNKCSPNFRTIYKSFIKFDPKQSGYVNLNDFQKALNQNGIFFKKFQIQVFQKAFSDEGKIHWFSLMSLLRQPMNPVRTKSVLQIFKSLDSNNAGRVHYSQLINKFDASQMKEFKLGFKTRQKIGQQLLALVPLTSDGFITLQQFINFYNDISLNIPDDQTFIKFICSQWRLPYLPSKKVKPQEIKSAIKLIRFKLIQRTEGTHEQFILKQLFNEFDVNKNNFLCLDQLQKMLIKLQIPLQERYTLELLQKMDHNKNGRIDFDEFKNFIFYEPYPF